MFVQKAQAGCRSLSMLILKIIYRFKKMDTLRYSNMGKSPNCPWRFLGKPSPGLGEKGTAMEPGRRLRPPSWPVCCRAPDAEKWESWKYMVNIGKSNLYIYTLVCQVVFSNPQKMSMLVFPGW